MSERELYPGWETVRKIGNGSFGAVYEIARTLPNGKVEKAALKVISIPQNEGDVEELYSNGYDDASITAHFKSYLADIVNEYSLMSEIKGHTNVVYCDDIRYIQHDDGFGWDIFIKMELLTSLIRVRDSDPIEGTVRKLASDICSALVLCREKNIVHRDIKPQNIFVSEHGDYKLGDFGIAKTVEKTTGGTKIGTYGYMAPEVYNNQPYGAAADIYSLGLVMYWLLNEHRLPFLPMPPKVPTSAENEQARLRRFRGEAIPAPKNGSEAMKRIVLKACAYDPKGRYHTADEMLADLNALQGSPTAAPEETAPAVEAEAPEDTETATRGAFTAETVAPAQDEITEKTEGTVGIFGREPEKEETKPQEKAVGQKKPPKRIYATILGGVLCAALAFALVWILSSKAPSPVVIPFSTALDEFDQVSAKLAEEAKLWTRETAPQKLTDFPFFPQPVFDLFETVKSIQAEVNVADSTFTLDSNLLEGLPLSTLGDVESRQFLYYIDSNDKWTAVALEAIGNSTYALPTPVDESKNNSSQKVFVDTSVDSGTCDVYLQIYYDISEEHNHGAAVEAIDLSLANDDCMIQWECNLRDSIYAIWVHPQHFEREYRLTYGMVNGNLVEMSDAQVP